MGGSRELKMFYFPIHCGCFCNEIQNLALFYSLTMFQLNFLKVLRVGKCSAGELGAGTKFDHFGILSYLRESAAVFGNGRIGRSTFPSNAAD